MFRLLVSGGIFLYPWDSKVPGQPGKLRLLYEASPLAFIAEAAGGAATDGERPILDIEPAELHQRTPLDTLGYDEPESSCRLS